MESLNKSGHTNFSRFFQSDADENLRQFAIGNLDFLVSCHIEFPKALISKPSARSFCSARHPPDSKPFRGLAEPLERVLRPKRALVIDFVYDNPNSTSNPDMKRKKWLETSVQGGGIHHDDRPKKETHHSSSRRCRT